MPFAASRLWQAALKSQGVFTVAQRAALRERLLRLATEDQRVVAGADVGSLAVDGGDRLSDLDLTFGIADHVPVAEVLDEAVSPGIRPSAKRGARAVGVS